MLKSRIPCSRCRRRVYFFFFLLFLRIWLLSAVGFQRAHKSFAGVERASYELRFSGGFYVFYHKRFRLFIFFSSHIFVTIFIVISNRTVGV